FTRPGCAAVARAALLTAGACLPLHDAALRRPAGGKWRAARAVGAVSAAALDGATTLLAKDLAARRIRAGHRLAWCVADPSAALAGGAARLAGYRAGRWGRRRAWRGGRRRAAITAASTASVDTVSTVTAGATTAAVLGRVLAAVQPAGIAGE